jgi:hypothetical protein
MLRLLAPFSLFFSRNGSPHRKFRRDQRIRLTVEGLEDRCLLASYSAVGPWAVVVPADLNGDGTTEMVGLVKQTGNWWATNANGSFFSNSPLGNWNPLHTYGFIQAVDLDNSGPQEIIGLDTTTGNWLSLAWQNGQGQVTTLGSWPAAGNFANVHVANLNGSHVDILGLSQATGDWHDLHWDNGAYADDIVDHWDPTAAIGNIQFADLNGNGGLEIVGQSRITGDWHILSYVGNGGFADQVVKNSLQSANLTFMTVADLDGSGHQDIIGENPATGQWYGLCAQNGTYTVISLGRWSRTANFQNVLAADIDGNGTDEIVGRDAVTGNWWEMKDTNGTWKTVLLTGGINTSRWSFVTVGDVDGDGKADIIGYNAQVGTWRALVQGGTVNRLIGYWNPNNNYQQVQCLDLNHDGKTDIFGVLPSTAAFWTIQSLGSQFTNVRLASINPDITLPVTTVTSDSMLIQLIQGDIPALAYTGLLSVLDMVRLLRDWTANTFVTTSSAAIATQTNWNIQNQSAAALYDLFVTHQRGGYCGAAAVFFDKILKLFGFNSFTIDFGTTRDALTHVSDVVGFWWGGQWNYYLEDPTFNGDYVTATGQPATVGYLVNQRLSTSNLRFVSSPLDGLTLVQLQPSLRTDVVLTRQSGSKYYYWYMSYGLNFYIQQNAAVIQQDGYSTSYLLLPQLLATQVFAVGTALDPTASSGFIAQLHQMGIPAPWATG